MESPFSKENELNKELNRAEDAEDAEDGEARKASEGDETCGAWGRKAHQASLPGQPLVRLGDTVRMREFLELEYWNDDLERMGPYLWLLSTQSSANICPLHHQRLLGREIVITEDPGLHLVWYYDRIFIKPLPRYLLSHRFWTGYLLRQRDPIKRAALGYIRTYMHLIKHESDFAIAVDEQMRLVPAGISWEDFCAFVSTFHTIDDASVSKRFHYGELRLSRLNFYCIFILRKLNYKHLQAQYASYINSYFAPLLFAFASTSLLLSAMQLEFSIEQTFTRTSLQSLPEIYRWFSIVVMLAGAAVVPFLLLIIVIMITDEAIYALKTRWRKKYRGDPAEI